jgi:hypothetical protein
VANFTAGLIRSKKQGGGAALTSRPAVPANGRLAIPRFAPRRQRYAQRRVIAFTLLAPVRDMLFFFAKAIHGPV